MKNGPFRQFLALFVISATYFLSGRLGLSLATINPSATTVWAPTGIAIAAFLIFGQGIWPAILTAAFLVNLTTSKSLAASVAIAGGNTAEGLIGAMLIEHFASGRKAFNRTVDVFKFALFGAGLAPMISASIGVLALATNHLAQWNEALPIWCTWWLGDATGALVITPVLVMYAEPATIRMSRWLLVETIAVLAGFVIAGMIAFTQLSPVGMYDYPLFLLVIPLVLAAAFRLRRRETALAIVILAGMAVWGTANGLGPFARYTPNTSLLLLQIFMALTTMIGLVVAAEVSDRRRAEAALRDREQLYHLVIESATDAIVTIDDASTITYVNQAVERLFGYTRDELIGHELTLLMPDQMRMPHLAGFVRYLATGQRTIPWQSREVQGRHKDGHLIPLEISFGEHYTKRRLFTGVIRDISERQRAQAAQRWLATIVANSMDAVVGMGTDGVVVSWNQGAEMLYGYTAEEMIGQSVARLFPTELENEHTFILARLRKGESIGHFETERLCKGGQRICVSVTVSPIDDGNGRLLGASSVARDITEQKRAEARIQFLAHHDALTGLPNRLFFRDHLGAEVAAAARDHRRVAVLFIDLDRFKIINDEYGHDVGDQVLQTVAQRLQHNLRSADMVARLGGDEFVIVLGNKPTPEEAQSIAAKVLAALRAPMILIGRELVVGASIGIGLFPDDGTDEQSLLKCADQAMYQAKQNGRNTIRESPTKSRKTTSVDIAPPVAWAADRHDTPLPGRSPIK